MKYLILIFLFIGCRKVEQVTPFQQTIIENKSTDDCIIVPCIDCEGTGTFVYRLDDPLVELGLVPEGSMEDCQTCKAIGKLKRCTVANGMVYYMSL